MARTQASPDEAHAAVPHRHRGDTGRALGGYVAIAAIAVGIWATAASAADPSPAPSASGTTVTEARQGADLFTQSCAACHGMAGAGTSQGPAIADAGAALTDLMLRSGRMPLAAPGAPDQRGPVAFNDSQIRAIVAYVASLGQGPPIPNVVVDGADLVSGRALYTANCAACHGPAAGGGAVGGGFVAPPLQPADPTQIGEAALGGPGPMPRFSLTPQQLNDLAGYVESLDATPNPGGVAAAQVGPVVEGFVAAIALVLLLVVARWIAVRQRGRS